MLPLDWWREQWNMGLRDFSYADIAYADGQNKELVHAGRFMATRRVMFFGLNQDDRHKGIRMEFSSTGGELELCSVR